MEKKIYIQPNLTVLEIFKQDIVRTSNPTFDSKGDNTFSDGFDEYQ